MGSRNLDRISPSEWRLRCPTVAELMRDHIDVIAKCERCGLQTVVDLRVVALVSGPAASLWNRKARCKKLGCGGWVHFEAKFWGMNIYQPMRAAGHG
jgi:hypothetical protein